MFQEAQFGRDGVMVVADRGSIQLCWDSGVLREHKVQFLVLRPGKGWRVVSKGNRESVGLKQGSDVFVLHMFEDCGQSNALLNGLGAVATGGGHLKIQPNVRIWEVYTACSNTH